MVSISRTLQRIKGDLDTLLSETYLSNLAREAGCRWRERCLGPAVTIQLFVLQILHGNVCCARASPIGCRRPPAWTVAGTGIARS